MLTICMAMDGIGELPRQQALPSRSWAARATRVAVRLRRGYLFTKVVLIEVLRNAGLLGREP